MREYIYLTFNRLIAFELKLIDARCTYIYALTHLFGFVFGRNGAPVFSLAFGYCDK